jgi:hypothetical protein
MRHTSSSPPATETQSHSTDPRPTTPNLAPPRMFHRFQRTDPPCDARDLADRMLRLVSQRVPKQRAGTLYWARRRVRVPSECEDGSIWLIFHTSTDYFSESLGTYPIRQSVFRAWIAARFYVYLLVRRRTNVHVDFSCVLC